MCNEQLTPRMSSPKLYDICLKRISWFLREKFHDETPNIFYSVPSRIIHDLISCILTSYASGGFQSHFLEPLLLSGQVKYLALHNIRLDDELLPTLRSFTVCRGLRSLSLLNVCDFNVDIVSSLLEELLKALKNLEELHCSVVFHLSALRKCRRLRTAKLHFAPRCSLDDFLDFENGLTKAHESLALFTLCGQRADKFVPFKEVAELLVNCPKLRSLGYLDVSAAFGHLHDTTRDVRQYNLESCYWREHKVPDGSKMNFLSCIRAAALACPQLKELVIKIPQRHYRDTFPILSTLRNLTYLEVELDYPKRDFRPEISCLLSEIGSGLQHLALHRIDNIEFDVILKTCPQLQSLKVDCDRVAEKWSETPANPRQLRRLAFYCSDANNDLRLVLSKCSNLQELFLKNAQFLSDSFLSKILKDNPLAFAQLKTACICDCCLTEDGINKFLRSVDKLEKIYLHSSKVSEEDAEKIINNIGSKIQIFFDYDEGLCDEFFFKRRYVCF